MKKIQICCLGLLLLSGCSQKQTTSKQVAMGQSYYASHSDGDICLVSVAMENDRIVGVTLDEITYLSSDEYKGLPNTEMSSTFGKQTDGTKNLASKRQNDDAYSALMKANGATKGISENYQAICDYCIGKGVEDLRQEVTGKDEQTVTDVVTGCTLKSTKGYLEAVIEAAKNAK